MLKKNFYKLESFKLASINSFNLTKRQIKSICELKDKQWKFGIKSQINWYNKNIKRNDIHNLFYTKSKLIGYTLLRKRTCKIDKKIEKIKYLFFDTLVIDKKYIKKKLSNLIMNFNNTVIKKSGYFSFLICKKELVSFYKKFGWIQLKKENIIVKDHLFCTNGMIYNQKKKRKEKYYFFINK